jgi:hypothetical protein
MEQAEQTITPVKKVYKDMKIWIATFIGGPLAAGYVIAENFKAIGEPHKVKKTWIYTILASALIFAGLFFIPGADQIPNKVIPAIYTAAAYLIVHYFQHAKITSFVNSGGQVHGWGRALGVGFVGGVITLLPIAVMAQMSNTTSSVYGKAKNEIGFDANNISQAEIDEIAAVLTENGLFTDRKKIILYVKELDNNYEISMSIDESAINNEDVLRTLTEFRDQIQPSFPHHGIVLNLCFNNLDNVVHRIEQTDETTEVKPKNSFQEIDVERHKEALDIFKGQDEELKEQMAEIILGNPNYYNPVVLYAMSQHLFEQGEKEVAIFWFLVAKLRGRYDANLCMDRSARQALTMLNMQFGQDIGPYALQDLKRLERTISEAVAFVRDNEEDYDHRWISLHGMNAIRGTEALSQPESEWARIKEETCNTFYNDMIQDIKKQREKSK